MPPEKPAICVKNLCKYYQIYEKPGHRLRQFVMPRLDRFIGRTPRNYYREFRAMDNVSFDVRQGETFGIIGRNGSGKSTLLQLICGTLSPTVGSVETVGRVAALLELGAGFNPEFTGRENVHMNASILGISDEEIEAKFDQIISFAEIGDFIDQPVKTYSSGMYVRLAFAVIAHVDADILVIDEALAVGDAFFTQKCMRFLRNFREKGTILFVSHDSAAVVNLCQRVLWLNEGRIVLIGAARDVCEAYLQNTLEKIGDVEPTSPKQRTTAPVHRVEPVIDPRWQTINQSTLRNDLLVFPFIEQSGSFGTEKARIQEVKLLDERGSVLRSVVGGETVTLRVVFFCNEPIGETIVGFIVKDRLGQHLFGDNTCLTYRDHPQPFMSGESGSADFCFQMPILPVGDYSVTVAVAEGTQYEPVQHHWLHDALIIKSITSSVCTGLVGVPMFHIELRKSEKNEEM